MKTLFFLFLMMLLPMGAEAYDAQIDGIYYSFNKNAKTATVTCYYNGSSNQNAYSGTVNIPPTVNYSGETYDVTGIGDYAFLYCSGLTSVTIPNSVTSIGRYAFRYCSGLTSITIPGSVTWIGQYAFEGCSGLTSVTIPNSVTSIGSCAFSGCSGLTSVKVESGNKVYDSRNDCNAIIKTESNELICGCMNTAIPNSVTSIGYSAFEGCSGLTSVTIPNSVKSIGREAFYGCSGLTSVKVESGNKVYDSRNDCNAIIKTESNELIWGCMNTAIPNSVTSIGNYAFSGCSGLTSVTIPNSVTSIGDAAFAGCSGLTSVTIPNSVTRIGCDAFSGCSGLTSVTIPNSVTSIGGYAFSNCSGLMSVKSFIAEPFNVTGLFSDETYRQGTLYVPIGTKDLYIRYDGWREFLKIEEVGAEPAPNGQCAKPTIIIAGKGMRYECETPGAEYESILTTEEQRFTGNKLVMDNKDLVYILTVYATAPDYDRSEPAQVKFVVSRNDVNQDGVVNVADIATIIDAMAAQARMQEEAEE